MGGTENLKPEDITITLAGRGGAYSRFFWSRQVGLLLKKELPEELRTRTNL